MKDKIIEEMAQCKNSFGITCNECCTKACDRYALAEELYDAGYRKIPELPKDTVLKTDDIAELLTVVAKDTRKETAEKFAEKVSKAFIGLNCIDIDEWNWCQRKIDEICKEIIGEKV